MPQIDAKLGERLQCRSSNRPTTCASRAGSEDAFDLLAAETKQHPDNWDANLALWDVALQLGSPEEAPRPRSCAASVRICAGGEHDLAILHWLELTEHIPDPQDRSSTSIFTWREAMIRGAARPGSGRAPGRRTTRTLGASLPLGTQDPSGEQSLPNLPQRQRSGDLPVAAKRSQRCRRKSARRSQRCCFARARGSGPARTPTATRRGEACLARPPEPGGEANLARPPEPGGEAGIARPHRVLRVISAVPKRLTGEKISVDVAGQGARLLPLKNVQAVAAARIDDGFADAFVVIDLLVDSLWSDKPKIRTVRLRSNEFDARGLVEAQQDPHQALVVFIENVVAISGASPVPDADSIKGQPFYSFASLPDYESKIFGFVAG